MRKEKDLIFSPQSKIRKASTKLKMDDLKKTFNRQISQKSLDSFHETLSILKQKKFFKKDKYFYFNDETTNAINDKKTDRRESRDDFNVKINEKENDSELEDIYFNLVKFIIEGKNKMFKTFFEKNREYIDINQELFEGNTLLILCAREGNLYITKFLCDENAEVNTQNNNGNTALHYAIGKQFYALADILTRHGAREDIKNAKGFAPWDCIDHNID
jgi:ankyrin repeat protein